MSNTYAKKLFTSAVIFNFLVAIAFLAQIPPIGTILAIDSYPPTANAFLQITFLIVVLCGWAYLKVANDPIKYQPYITFGILIKAIFVIVIVAYYLMGSISWILPSLVLGDVVWIVLFYLYNKSHK